MPAADADARRLRAADAEAADAATGVPTPDPAVGATLLCKTVAVGTYPTTANLFFAVTPQTVLGAEAEGAAGTLTADPTVFHAYNCGYGLPTPGTEVLVTYVPYRWVFRYDG